jgi:hypothetical protein
MKLARTTLAPEPILPCEGRRPEDQDEGTTEVATQQLFHRTAVPVSFKRHKGWSVKTGETYAFASEVNSVPLTAIEFAEAAAEYPVVFAAIDDQVVPAVILGPRDAENLHVGHDGRWLGTYVPAVVRCYPFGLMHDAEDGTLTPHIDETFPGCNQVGRGERLFDADGAQTPYLRTVLGFLQDHQARVRRTRAYCDRLLEFGLLQPLQGQVALGCGERCSLSGFMAVDRAKLKALPQQVVAGMLARDELEWTFLHLASLRHVQEMIDRCQAGPTEAPQEPDLVGAGEEGSGLVHGAMAGWQNTAQPS